MQNLLNSFHLVVSNLYSNHFNNNNSSNNIDYGYNSLVLPVEVINKIFSYLNEENLSVTASVCRFWNYLPSNIAHREKNIKRIKEIAVILIGTLKDPQDGWCVGWRREITLNSLNDINPNWSFSKIQNHIIEELSETNYDYLRELKKRIENGKLKQICELSEAYMDRKVAKVHDHSNKQILLGLSIEKFLKLNKLDLAMETASLFDYEDDRDFSYRKIALKKLSDGRWDEAIVAAKSISNKQEKKRLLLDICDECVKNKNLDMALEAANAIEDSQYKTYGLRTVAKAFIEIKNIDKAIAVAHLLPDASEREKTLEHLLSIRKE